eukprot:scaffold2216_cov99-Skeletonema_marinoi.AAC.1
MSIQWTQLIDFSGKLFFFHLRISFDRRLVYGEHRALLSDGEHSAGRELFSLGNGSCYYYYYDGLTIYTLPSRVLLANNERK